MTIDTASWGASQWTILIVSLLIMVSGCAVHGKPRAGTYHAGAIIFAQIIYLAILNDGGFFG